MTIRIIDGLLEGHVIESRKPLPRDLVLEYPLAPSIRATHYVQLHYAFRLGGYVQYHVRKIDPVGT